MDRIFKELLNRPAPLDPPVIQAAEEDLPINCGIPSKEEVKKAILLLRSGKATGPDGIPAEALKADIDTSTEILHNLLAKIWVKEEIPTNGERAIWSNYQKREISKNAQTTEVL